MTLYIAKGNHSFFAPKRFLIFLALGFLLFSSSCSKFQRYMKSSDPMERYNAGVKYYEKGDYYRAGLLFEDIIPLLAGKPEAEDAQFKFAYCHFHQDQFVLSAHYFKSFNSTYGLSDHSEEALFMSAYSKYKDIPDFYLDQSNTNAAIDAMQDFLNQYPNSKQAPQAEQVIEQLRGNLEKKAFAIAKQYQKLRRYKASVEAFNNFDRDFPDSERRVEIGYVRLQSKLEIAKRSVFNLKEDRLQNVLDSYIDYIELYPQSPFLRQAETIHKTATREMNYHQRRLKQTGKRSRKQRRQEKKEDKEAL